MIIRSWKFTWNADRGKLPAEQYAAWRGKSMEFRCGGRRPDKHGTEKGERITRRRRVRGGTRRTPRRCESAGDEGRGAGLKPGAYKSEHKSTHKSAVLSLE